MKRFPLTLLVLAAVAGASMAAQSETQPVEISGIYPHLAVFNNSRECGIGAVVPWNGKLWMITYPPHKPQESDDKLYAVHPDLTQETRPESVGGTHANRMVHRETDQLLIGRYLIDRKDNVRVLAPSKSPARLTACARHLQEPERKVYYFGMEGRLYEVDVKTLEVNQITGMLEDKPGSHGKGAYTAQDRLVICNNGTSRDKNKYWRMKPTMPLAAGALAEFNGEQWSTVVRHQFCEATGPGGIYGNENPADPLWATGWDHRSVILKLLDGGEWHSFRLPKGSYTYDAYHGWYTEWPRIRRVADDLLLMNMHGMFYKFPISFSRGSTAGVTPLAFHLKMVVDYCNWQDRIVFGCDDASQFDNPLVGQAQSNLWFVERSKLDGIGPEEGWGGPWVRNDVKAGTTTVPFLFHGFDRRVLHLSHDSTHPVTFTLELDRRGTGHWEKYREIEVAPEGYEYHVFPPETKAWWIRLRAQENIMGATAYFHYSEATHPAENADNEMFTSLPRIDSEAAMCGGIVRPRGADLGTLQYIARKAQEDGSVKELQYHAGPDVELERFDNPGAAEWFKERGDVTNFDFKTDEASIILTEKGQRYRLPRSNQAYDEPFEVGYPRGKREVVTERSLLNCHGTFYEVPRYSAGGLARMRPVCTHNRRITDFCSWRGLLVMAGTKADAKNNGHFRRSQDGKAGLWFGTVDDLWKLGKPRGHGGPWLETKVEPDKPSDPYLMTGYDHKTMKLSHDADRNVEFTIEVDILGDDTWVTYDVFIVPSGETVDYHFPAGYSAHWIRARVDRPCSATMQLTYE